MTAAALSAARRKLSAKADARFDRLVLRRCLRRSKGDGVALEILDITG